MFFIFRVKFFFFIPILCFSFIFFLQQPALASSKIIINKGVNQLAFFEDGYLLDVFPVATGSQPQFTPEGNWKVIVKLLYPSWRHPKGGPVIPGGIPENPLGPRWLGLNALGTGGSGYGIHGNNNPSSIGTYASSGCVRMYNEDILWLYDRVPVGTEVEIINSKEDLSTWKRFARVTVNGVEPEFAPHLGPVQTGDTTYLPVRPTVSAMGYRLLWDGSSNTLLVSNIDREVVFTVGSNRVTVNNTVMNADAVPFLLEETTFAPDYYFQRFLGAEIYRDEGSKTLSLNVSVDPTGGGLAKYHLTVRIDGKIVNLPETLTPLTDGENLLVPVRPVCAAFGAAVNWNDAAKSVEIKIRAKQVSIPINGSPARVNGAVLETPANIITRNGSSYVNLRFLAAAFGFQTEVDDRSRTLNISTFNSADMFTNPFRQLKTNSP